MPQIFALSFNQSPPNLTTYLFDWLKYQRRNGIKFVFLNLPDNLTINFAQQAFFSNELKNYSANREAYISRQRIPLPVLHIVNENTPILDIKGSYNLALLHSAAPLDIINHWPLEWLPDFWVCTNAYDYSQLKLNGIDNTIYIPLFRHSQLPSRQQKEGWLSEYFSIWVEGIRDKSTASLLTNITKRLSRVISNIAICVPEGTANHFIETIKDVKTYIVKPHEQPLVSECNALIYLPQCTNTSLRVLPNQALLHHLNIIIPSEGFFLDYVGEHCFHYAPETAEQSETEIVQRLIRLSTTKNHSTQFQHIESYLKNNQPNLVFELLAKSMNGWVPDQEMQAKWLFSSALQAQIADNSFLAVNLYSLLIDKKVNSQLLSALVNRANIYLDHDQINEALQDFEYILDMSPNQINAVAGMGSTLRSKGQLDQAARYYEQAVKLTPSAKYHWKLAFHYLLQGRYEEAWPHFEYRHEALNLRQVKPDSIFRWKPEEHTKGNLLILDEQGIGDTLQFLRFIEIMHNQTNLKVYFAGKVATLPALKHILPAEQVLDWDKLDRISNFDFWAPLMSLPMHMGINSTNEIPPPLTSTWQTLPTDNTWKGILKSNSRPVVALCWRGNPDFKADKSRSPGLKPLLSLLDMNNIHFVSLQINELAIEEIHAFSIESRIQDLGSTLRAQKGTLLDTFSILKQCDYVVTSCTSMAHMAGILGIPTLAMLPVKSDWRWLTDRQDSPWYPSISLIRQERHGEWAPSVSKVKAVLANTFSTKIDK